MKDPTAQAISTVGIWIAVAIILTWGVFRVNWNDFVALFCMVAIVCVICGAAGISTAAIWGHPISFNRDSNKAEKP